MILLALYFLTIVLVLAWLLGICIELSFISQSYWHFICGVVGQRLLAGQHILSDVYMCPEIVMLTARAALIKGFFLETSWVWHAGHGESAGIPERTGKAREGDGN